jgi:hypothetical protein
VGRRETRIGERIERVTMREGNEAEIVTTIEIDEIANVTGTRKADEQDQTIAANENVEILRKVGGKGTTREATTRRHSQAHLRP